MSTQGRAQFTPGPWAIRYATNITAISTPKGEMQLSLHGIYDGLKPLSVDLHEWKANAHLIAAAPVMYADLRIIRDYLYKLYDDGNMQAGEYAASLDTTLAQADGKQ